MQIFQLRKKGVGFKTRSQFFSVCHLFFLDASRDHFKISMTFLCLYLNNVHVFLQKALVIVMKKLLKHSWEESCANQPHLQTKRHLEKWHRSLLSAQRKQVTASLFPARFYNSQQKSPCRLLRSEFTGMVEVLMTPFCSGSMRRGDVCIIADSSVAIQDC